MRNIGPLAVAAITLTLAVLLPIAALSAQTPARALEPTSTPIVSESPTPSPEPSATPNTCWDCPGSTYTWAEARVWFCTEERAEENPSILDECWPDKWEWVCFSEDPIQNIKEHCEMYRQDLDPLGIFATPPPMTTPLPTASP
jgi:hypothetical protein